MVEIIKISAKRPDKKIVGEAAAVIKAGGLVIYPTETAYGLGATALDKKAVSKAYKVKKREVLPLPIIVADLKMAQRCCSLTKEEIKVAKRIMPGPLTLVVKKKKIVPDILTKGLPTVAFRISSSKVATAISKVAGVPLTATSANISRVEPTRYSIKEMSPELKDAVDLVLDAGKLKKTKPSTLAQIVDSKVKILREGPVSKKKIEKALY